MSDIFCQKCGTKANKQTRFCDICGNDLLEQAKAEEALAETREDTLVVDEFTETVYEVQPADEVAVEDEGAPKLGKVPASSRYGKRKALRSVLAVFICIFMFLWSVCSVLLFSIKQCVTEEALRDITKNAVETVLSDIKAKDIIKDAAESIGDKSVIEWVLDQVEENSDHKVNMTPEEIKVKAEEFLENSTIVTALSGKAYSMIDTLLNDDGYFQITKEDIRQIVTENNALFKSKFNATITEKDLDKIFETVDKSGALEKLNSVNLRNEINKKLPVNLDFVNLAIKYGGLAFSILTLLFAVLLALTNRWNMLSTARDTGIVLATAGGLLAIGGVVGLIIVADLIPATLVWLTPIAKDLITDIIIKACIAFGIGALLIAANVTGMYFVRKYWAKKAAD